jgi:hypothetical protein
MVPWDTLTFMGRNQHGIVNLFYTLREKPNWLQRLGRLELSYFVDDWQTGELVAEIKKYAPQVKIPEDLLAQPQRKIWQRPGMTLLYDVISLFLTIAIILIAYLPYLQPIRFTLLLAGYGFWGGIFGGMMSLFDYSSWLKYQANKKFFGKVELPVAFQGLGACLPFRIDRARCNFRLELLRTGL